MAAFFVSLVRISTRGISVHMTLIRPEGDDGVADRILTAAREHFYETAKEIDKYRKRLQADDKVPASELKKLRGELKVVAHLYYAEASRLADESRKKAGVVHQHAIDFDAARQEIRRRMACLRSAHRSGELSE
ncbi:MAG: hypothetical protein ACU0DI_15505 [Paracoccaceae bacterium]